MSHQFETSLRPPPGVSFTQWADGSIRIKYSTRDVLAIRKTLLDLARNLTNEALDKLKADKNVEIERQRLPLTRLQQINLDMKSLETEMKGIETEKLDLSELQRDIDERIKAAEVPKATAFAAGFIKSEESYPQIENAPGVSVSTTIDVAEFED